MKIEVYSGKELRTGALRALKYRLFQNNWQLGSYYRDIRDHHENNLNTILIAIVDDKPVASAACFSYICEFQVFVRGKYRRKGIGSSLYAHAMKIKNRTKPLYMWVDHSKKAYNFYEKNRKKDWIAEEKDDTVTIEVPLTEKMKV